MKRKATQQAERTTKKTHVEKPQSDAKSKKRSLPVTSTAPLQDSDVTSDEEGPEELQDEESADDKMEGVEETTGSQQPKDPNASREGHKAQRALLAQRRAAKPHSELLTEAKLAWSLARKKDISKEERTKHINALMDILRGHVKEIVFKHDASRIVQTVVKYGGQKERNEIASELKGRYQELAQNKYSKFLVTKLIRLCPQHRTSILQEFQGHVRRLLLHREASTVLADAFELYANAYERSILLKDFYGKEAKLFTVTSGSDEEQEKSKKGLKGLLEGADKDRRRRLLSSVKDNLISIFNNPDKGSVSHAIVHRVLWEYISALNTLEDEAEREKLRREIFESCQDVLAEMVHTKDGSRVDRKHIVKTIKPHIERMCIDEEAQLVLFTALDVIDDTKMTAKSIVSDIVGSATNLYTSAQGRRCLIYLVSPRTRRHFTPAQIKLLAETDSIRAQTSKKDNDVRAEEIRKAASEPLLSWITKLGAEVVRDPGGSLVVGEIMLNTDGDKSAASETLLKSIARPYPSPDAADPHPISLPHVSRLFKLLLQGGHFSHETKTIVRSERFSSLDFAQKFVDIVGKDTTLAMAKDEGIFVVAALCETVVNAGKDGESWFTPDARKELEAEKDKRGMSTLLSQVESL
ncbi:puf family RNA-binding protein [Panus rudis PR-1116 ss-1]|nr:puf family RNA-binding protein [Panus rudis PR-1116 ss-1]